MDDASARHPGIVFDLRSDRYTFIFHIGVVGRLSPVGICQFREMDREGCDFEGLQAQLRALSATAQRRASFISCVGFVPTAFDVLESRHSVHLTSLAISTMRA